MKKSNKIKDVVSNKKCQTRVKQTTLYVNFPNEDNTIEQLQEKNDPTKSTKNQQNQQLNSNNCSNSFCENEHNHTKAVISKPAENEINQKNQPNRKVKTTQKPHSHTKKCENANDSNDLRAPSLKVFKILNKRSLRSLRKKGGGYRGGNLPNQKKQTRHPENFPSISFSPGPKEHIRMVEILNRKKTDPERKKLVTKIGQEFLRMYTRYRRRMDISYQTIDKEKIHAETAATLCIYKKITPAQLINYWADNVNNFTSLKFPPLSFLASPSNVDSAACAAIDDKSECVHPGVENNVYNDLDKLNSRLRIGLERSGYPVAQYDDRYLMSIQCAAQAIASGHDMFVSSKMKPLVWWAVKNLF